MRRNPLLSSTPLRRSDSGCSSTTLPSAVNPNWVPLTLPALFAPDCDIHRQHVWILIDVGLGAGGLDPRQPFRHGEDRQRVEKDHNTPITCAKLRTGKLVNTT